MFRGEKGGLPVLLALPTKPAHPESPALVKRMERITRGVRQRLKLA
jgi:hypothetical protein